MFNLTWGGILAFLVGFFEVLYPWRPRCRGAAGKGNIRREQW